MEAGTATWRKQGYKNDNTENINGLCKHAWKHSDHSRNAAQVDLPSLRIWIPLPFKARYKQYPIQRKKKWEIVCVYVLVGAVRPLFFWELAMRHGVTGVTVSRYHGGFIFSVPISNAKFSPWKKTTILSPVTQSHTATFHKKGNMLDKI